jgi:hypothetical protein
LPDDRLGEKPDSRTHSRPHPEPAGPLKVRGVNLAELAAGFGGKAKVDSHGKRLQRFFRSFDLDYDDLARFLGGGRHRTGRRRRGLRHPHGVCRHGKRRCRGKGASAQRGAGGHRPGRHQSMEEERGPLTSPQLEFGGVRGKHGHHVFYAPTPLATNDAARLTPLTFLNN